MKNATTVSALLLALAVGCGDDDLSDQVESVQSAVEERLDEAREDLERSFDEIRDDVSEEAEAALDEARDAVDAVDERTREELEDARRELDEARDELRAEADVVVDQLFMGWYGMVAVEAMALGKPVLCYVRPDFEDRLERCPIVRCTKESLAAKLDEVLAGSERARLGEEGRAFVERENAAPVVARRLIELYREIGAGGREAPAGA